MINMGDENKTNEELLFEIKMLKEQLDNKRNLEKELAKTRILMQTAFDQSPVPLVVVTYPDFAFKIINKAMEDFVLVNVDDYINKTPFEINVTWKDSNPDGTITNPIEAPLPLAMKGVVTKNKESFITRHDGSIVWCLASAAPIYDDENQLIGAIYAATDITKRKESEKIIAESEKKLKEQNEEYEAINEELRETNEKLQIAKLKAEESDRLKTAFLQNMSHEIRTPMNAIMGFSSFLVRHIQDKEKIEKFSEIISLRCNDLLCIINDILDISKIESGQLDVNLEDCMVNSLFEDLFVFFNEYKKRNDKENIQLRIEQPINYEIIKVKTDKVKLKQILINLISNAFKFTFEGSIICGYKIEKDYLFFYVKDTGIGIPEDKYKLIFERFLQLNQLPQKNIGGTGLGLSIVEGLVHLLGGKVWLESELGKGTTFYFTIANNRFDNSSIFIDEAVMECATDFSNKSILIVEDDYFNSMYLNEILSEHNFKIKIVNTGRKAIEIASTHHFDLILMDIRLPDISGYDATHSILEVNRNTQIIAQTAYAAIDERVKALKAGCVDYISKPTKKEDLIKMIKKHVLIDKMNK
jgi:signal transduction histidine kinase/ActR/RegA family two-component response regulator